MDLKYNILALLLFTTGLSNIFRYYTHNFVKSTKRYV